MQIQSLAYELRILATGLPRILDCFKCYLCEECEVANREPERHVGIFDSMERAEISLMIHTQLEVMIVFAVLQAEITAMVHHTSGNHNRRG